jgi:hypothetical protein
VDPNCPTCRGEGWVCEEHPGQPFEHYVAQTNQLCPGPGMPCSCNPTETMPPDFKVHCSIDDPKDT